MFIHKKICSLKIPVDDIVLMQIAHPFCNVKCNFKQRLKFESAFLFVKKIINAPPSHKLCHKDETRQLSDMSLWITTQNLLKSYQSQYRGWEIVCMHPKTGQRFYGGLSYRQYIYGSQIDTENTES